MNDLTRRDTFKPAITFDDPRRIGMPMPQPHGDDILVGRLGMRDHLMISPDIR